MIVNGQGRLILDLIMRDALWMLVFCSLLTPVWADLAPGYKPLAFKADPPGSYQLPVIEQAADGEVIDSEGHHLKLHDLMGDKVFY